jgi:hypothetical protein
LKIPLDFAWENIVKQFRNVEGGKQRGYDLFYSPTEECFIKHVDTLFGTSSEDYPFKVRELEKHKQIVELIDKIDMDSIDLGVDAFGFVYEDELSHSKGARKNGEHFTDRKICDYMTKLVNPRVNADGVPESVCDPSMGTGGFLFTYQKFFKDAKIDVNWNIHKHRIYGQDVINSSVCKAKMNLYVNTNMVCENLVLRNSLTNDLQNTSFDIILANMPFGLKGVKHADCCERVKGLKIRGTKSEPLFLQLMMVSLAPGGRCAVVVPDGMLVNTSTLHDQTRKYLLDHFELKRVIKMKGQFFINTGIQPSILFFENTGKPTTAIEFWEVVRNEKGDITESMIISVPREKIDASYSFDMRRYPGDDKLISATYTYPSMKISDVVSLKYGFPFKSSDYTTEGLTVVKHNNITDGYVSKSKKQDYIIPSSQTDEYKLNVGDIVISMDFDCGKVGKIVEDGWVLNQRVCLAKTKSETLRQGYLYWFMRFGGFYEKMQSLHTGTTIKHISGKSIEKAHIIIPPLSVQDEIIARLNQQYKERDEAMKVVKEADSKAISFMASYLPTTAPPTPAVANVIVYEEE